MRLIIFTHFMACLLLVSSSCLAQDKFDFYVSDKGNDTYPGNLKILPKKTLSATAPLLKNYAASRPIVKLGLRSGDVFEDNLITSYPIKVGTYKDDKAKDDFAVLSGSKEFRSGWVKDSSAKNIYGQAISYSGFVGYGINGIGSYSHIYVTEIDKVLEQSAPFTARRPMKLVTSLEQLEKSPGSYYTPVNTIDNPRQVFVHTSDGSSPNENTGYRYEVTVRDWAINSTYQANNVFENLWVRGFGAGNGILPGGDNSYYNRIVFGPGAGIHHLGLRSGTINNSLFLPGSRNTNEFSVVFYDVEGLNRHCTIKNSMFLDISTPVYAHTSLGTNFGAVELDHVIAFADKSLPGGFMFTANTDSVFLNNIYADGYTTGYNYGSAKYSSIKNSYFNEVSFGLAYSPKNPVTALVDNVFIKTKNYGEATGIYRQKNTTFSMTNSIVHISNKSNRDGNFIYGNAEQGINITVKGNIFICDVDASRSVKAGIVNSDSETGTSGNSWNNNVYVLLRGNRITWSITNGKANSGDIQIQQFEEWKRRSGQDKNSLFFDLRNDPRGLRAIFVDPANGNYDLANTKEGLQIAALKAGMTTPLNCFLQKPSYEQAADLIRNNKIIDIHGCKNPCLQNKIKMNSAFGISPFNNRQVKLNWTISEQENIDHYEIRKATGNSDFKKIKSIAVTSDSLYSFIDDIQAGITYQYRLAVIPRGSGKCYSDIRSIRINDARAFSIYPNPSSGKFSVSLNGYVGKAGITILNEASQPIFKEDIFSLYSVHNFDLHKQPKGIYFIKVETNKGVSVQKLLLQ